MLMMTLVGQFSLALTWYFFPITYSLSKITWTNPSGNGMGSLEFSVNQFDEYVCAPAGKKALNTSTSARLLEKLYISKFCLNKNGKTKRSCKQEYTCSTRIAIFNLNFSSFRSRSVMTRNMLINGAGRSSSQVDGS